MRKIQIIVFTQSRYDAIILQGLDFIIDPNSVGSGFVASLYIDSMSYTWHFCDFW